MENKNKTVCIVGAGFVGATAYQAFSKVPGWDVCAYDKFPDKSKLKNETPDAKFVDFLTAAACDLILVCVPTPMDKESGQCFTGIVETVISELRVNRNSEIVIKSTIPPGTTKRLNDEFGGIFFNPEFLTEADAYNDFVNLPYQIIGNPPGGCSFFLRKLYQDAANSYSGTSRLPAVLGGKMILECDSTVAEMIKLTRNCYLATRLSFFNEIKQICDKLEISYNDMKYLAGLDERVGSHYNKVPGPDGKVGFGGSCLCKDINDLMFVANELGVDPKTMRGVWEKNLEIRPERDWEELKGRAVAEKLAE